MLKAKESGRIINVASVIGLIGNAGQANYAASKAGLIGFTKSVALEIGSRGIRCNAICPGTVDSPSLRQRIADQAVRQGLEEAEVYRQFLDRQPMGRIGDTQEIAQLALYLGSDASAYTTGTVHVIDGGMSL